MGVAGKDAGVGSDTVLVAGAVWVWGADAGVTAGGVDDSGDEEHAAMMSSVAPTIAISRRML